MFRKFWVDINFFEWYCGAQNRAIFLVCHFSCNPRAYLLIRLLALFSCFGWALLLAIDRTHPLLPLFSTRVQQVSRVYPFPHVCSSVILEINLQCSHLSDYTAVSSINRQGFWSGKYSPGLRPSTSRSTGSFKERYKEPVSSRTNKFNNIGFSV